MLALIVPPLAPQIAFAHNTNVIYTTGKTPYEIVFDAKPQILLSVKLGLCRNKHKLCCSVFRADLPPQTQDENSTKLELLQKLLRPQLSEALLDRERDFKGIYSSTFERCRKQTARPHAYRTRFKLGHHLDVGQKVLYENHWQDLSKSLKLQQCWFGLFNVTKRATTTTYQNQDDKDPSIKKTVHRNHLVEHYPKEESPPAMIEEYVPHDQQNDADFSERFLEQRIGKLISFTKPLAQDSIPFPIRPIPTAPAVISHKRDSVASSDSRVGSPRVFSTTQLNTPEQLPQHPQETVAEQHSTSAPTIPSNPIQQFLWNSRKSKAREPRYVRPQPDDPNSQWVLRTLTRQGYTL